MGIASINIDGIDYEVVYEYFEGSSGDDITPPEKENFYVKYVYLQEDLTTDISGLIEFMDEIYEQLYQNYGKD